MSRTYRKHYVNIDNKYIPVKDWYRNNSDYFKDIQGIPTSEQIGVILIQKGFTRNETATEVLYKK